MNRFSDKTVIVTGASSGIGRASAIAFADEGADVVAVDLQEAPLRELADALGAKLRVVAGDLCLDETIDAVVAACGGRIDVLANVAGVMDNFQPVSEVTDSMWDRVLSVNLTAPMRLMRAVLPTMVAQGSGAIVNISSTAGYKGSAAGAAYTASKHGVIGLTRHAAVIYGPMGIRVNAIAPGAVKTGMSEVWDSSMARERLGPLFVANLSPAEPAETLAKHVLFLAGEDGQFINGAVLVSDGGWSAI